MEAGRKHGVHRRACLGEWDRNLEQELARCRVGDDRALVTDDEIVELRLLEIRAGCPEHPPGDDDDMGAGSPRARQRIPGAGTKDAVLGDQRPVEVECEGGDARRKPGRKLYGAVPPVEVTT
jgi:hypothetical protein